MALERLSFGERATPYNAMLAAEHMARYYFVRDLCRGKRVLDAACGEGYGSYLLAEWGAAEVVGVDLSGEAIATARRLFSKRNIVFQEGDVCRLATVLGDVAQFELIVSFETIEHVADPVEFLKNLRRYRSRNGAIIISCPNDCAEPEINPYHLKVYSFEQFKAMTTKTLGSASEWLLGMPSQGYMICPPGQSRSKTPTDKKINKIFQYRGLERTAVVPPQRNVAPNSKNCRFFVGCWGKKPASTAIISPQSFPAFLENYIALNYFKSENARLLTQVETQEADKVRLFAQLTEIEAENARLVARVEKSEAENARLVVGAEEREAEIALVVAQSRRRSLFHLHQIKDVNIQLDQMAKKLEQAVALAAQTEAENLRLVAESKERDAENALVLAHDRRRNLLHLRQLKDMEIQLKQVIRANAQLEKVSADSVVVRSIASALLKHCTTKTGERLIRHFAIVTGLFNADHYLANYPDVRAAKIDALKHFVAYGCVENRSPGPHFNALAYLEDNSDVRAAKLPAFLHYLEHELREGKLVKANY